MELIQLKNYFQVPWCLGGDFNEVKSNGERVGCLRNDRGMRDFNDFINAMEAHDLPMAGRRFTWTNFQDNGAQSRLDRFLLSQGWLDNFKVVQWGLHRPISDYCPILISNDNRDWGTKPFRFMDCFVNKSKVHDDC